MTLMNFNTPTFDKYKTWVSSARANGVSWDDIRKGYAHQSLDAFLQMMKACNFWDIDADTWVQLVDYMKCDEDVSNMVANTHVAATIYGVDQDNTLAIPSSRYSAWRNYKDKLLNKKGYTQEAVDNIERSCHETLKCLSRTTQIDDPRKGLVVGSVQSGKTGHMAGLMAMAADWGWNMFIVFSGSLENLRYQTEKRLIEDLNNRKSNFDWFPIQRDSITGLVAPGYRTWDLNLTEQSRIKYLSVCLKNSVRMKNLLDWLHSDQNILANMKILLIDDEADQATINTSDVQRGERSALNEALCNMVNGRTSSGSLSRGFGSMNYVAYTATPYANLLNESSRESLYPRHFINCLEASKEYFGAQQIFGDSLSGYDGIDIIRGISDQDVASVTDLYGAGQVDASDMPESLADSLSWYLCCVANMRSLGYKKPMSMLVHTSMRTEHHTVVASLISKWLLGDRQSILARCRNVWNLETNRFGLKELAAQYPDYSRLNKVREYEDFNHFSRYIDELLDDIRPIQIDAQRNISYHRGLHLCIDNSNEGINANGEHVRLLYPEAAQDFATAFIVVGGNTLSRGLTIEGLVSTYFFRTVKQADTLMQMGRWFGYRVGYELLPRIWMTDDALDKFQYLTQLDSELRLEINRMSVLGQTPDKYAARMTTLPSYIKITAANRMQSAEEADMDFSGTLLQTTTFDNDDNVLRQNLDVTEAFLSKLGAASVFNSYSPSNVIWQNVAFDNVKKYLEEYKFNDAVKRLNDISPLINWIEQMHNDGELKDWNVVLCGVQNQNRYTVGDISVGKISRSKLPSSSNVIYIKTLTSPGDFISDLNRDTMSFEVQDMIRANVDTRLIRTRSELGRCPQLLIYVIDKDSKAQGNSKRQDLNTNHDVIGLAINIPGHSNGNNNVRTIRVRLDGSSLIQM